MLHLSYQGKREKCDYIDNTTRRAMTMHNPYIRLHQLIKPNENPLCDESGSSC